MPLPDDPYASPPPDDQTWRPYLKKAVHDPYQQYGPGPTPSTQPPPEPAQGYGYAQQGYPPPGYPSQGYLAYPGATAPPASNGLAIASLCTGIVGWTVVPVLSSIAAIIFGHMARAQIRRTGEQGDGFAIAGLILGYTMLGLGALFIVLMISFFSMAAVGS